MAELTGPETIRERYAAAVAGGPHRRGAAGCDQDAMATSAICGWRPA